MNFYRKKKKTRIMAPIRHLKRYRVDGKGRTFSAPGRHPPRPPAPLSFQGSGKRRIRQRAVKGKGWSIFHHRVDRKKKRELGWFGKMLAWPVKKIIKGTVGRVAKGEIERRAKRIKGSGASRRRGRGFLKKI